MDKPQHQRILLVDDDPQIRSLLRDYLQQFGFECRTEADATGLRTAWADGTYDLVILDLMLPGEDGLSLCQWLRGQSRVPVLMLTARGEAVDRVVGLEMGADDYVVKPFEPRELVARMRSVLRRSEPAGLPTAPSADADLVGAEILRFAHWQLNRTTRELIGEDGVLVPLSNAEFRLLWVFIERPRRVLSRDLLLDTARGRAAEAFDRSIDLLVSRLRQKLGDDPKEPKLIRTIRGEGYLFDCKVAP
ncbi:response regulator [Chitinimonas sp. BJYL2]|uniref:response regulator n=1 Tax=Chitinimonas sp. BJYL2 TaxID=2976696 RepID=UPI0022B4E3BB|nr:response regulator [Chitinimonas sp. BJYL2]